MNRRTSQLALLCCFAGRLFGQVITTEVGADWTFTASGQAAQAAPLGRIYSTALDKNGNLYVADYDNHQAMKIGPDGVISVIAGNGFAGFSGDGGAAVNASLKYPQGIAVGLDGSVYISDTQNYRVRKITPDGVIQTIAGNGSPVYNGDGIPATSASLFEPNGVAVDAAGNVYIVDKRHSRIRKVGLDGMISTVAGNGQDGYSGDGGLAVNAMLNNPVGIAFDPTGSLYISDTLNNRIRKVAADGSISTAVGTGVPGFLDGVAAAKAVVSFPKEMSFDTAGDLFFSDPGNNLIRKVDTKGIVSTAAGSGPSSFTGDGGPATKASLGLPSGVAVSTSGNLYIADTQNERIRLVNTAGNISTYAGNGKFRLSANGLPAANSFLSNPQDAKFGPDGLLYIVDSENNRVVRLNSDGTITIVAGTGQYGFSGDGGPATQALLYDPRSIAFDTAKNMYIADSQNLRIRKVSPSGIITTFAGNGQTGYSGDGSLAVNAALNYSTGVAADTLGNVYIADQLNNVIRIVTSDGKINTFAGNGKNGFGGDGGPAVKAMLSQPQFLAVDAQNNLYIADIYNHRIRKVTSDKIIHTIAGTGAVGYSGDNGPAILANLYSPAGVSVDSSGNVFIADSGNNVIRMVATNGTISTVAGNHVAGFNGDGGLATAASLNQPLSLTNDSGGGLHIVDTLNNRIRKILTSPPSFQLSTQTLNFTVASGGAPPAAQAVNITSTVGGLGFTATASAGWLQTSAAGGQMPGNLAVNVDPSQLQAGSYTGTVTITAPQALRVQQTVQVSVTVSPGLPPKLAPSAQTLSFAFVQGSSSASDSFSLSNQGGGPADFGITAISDQNWLTTSTTSGTVTPAQPAGLNVTAQPGTLPPGTYSGSLIITSAAAGQTLTVPVVMTISAVPQKVLLSQQGLSFTAIAGGGKPLAQTFGILNSGLGSLSWTGKPTSTTGGAISWLNISSTSGTSNGPEADTSLVGVTVDPTGLAPGSYYGQIRVDANADNSPQFVTVLLKVNPAGTSLPPQVQPTGLIFTGVAGASPGSQTVLISGANSQAHNYKANSLTTDGGLWLKYLPSTAAISSSQTNNIVVQPDFTSLAAGVYQGSINILFDDSSFTSVQVLAIVAPASSGATASIRGNLQPEASGSCTPTLLKVLYTGSQGSLNVIPGTAVNLEAKVVDDCGNAIDGSQRNGAVTATFSTGDPSLPLTSIGSGQWSNTWQPRASSSGNGSITLAAFSSTGSRLLSGQVAVPVLFSSGATSTPLISGHVINAASFSSGAPLAPGSLVSIFGSQLAGAATQVNTAPLPTNLSNAEVRLNDIPLPLLYASDGQINAQLPYDVPANTPLQLLVRTGAAQTVGQSVIVSSAEPAIFTTSQNGSGQGAIMNVNSVLVDQNSPAAVGDAIVIYCTGLGAVDPPVLSGTSAPSSPPATTVNPVTVTIGGISATPFFAGLAPNYAGLYQVNVIVPPGVAPSDQTTVTITEANQTSPPVTIATH